MTALALQSAAGLGHFGILNLYNNCTEDISQLYWIVLLSKLAHITLLGALASLL